MSHGGTGKPMVSPPCIWIKITILEWLGATWGLTRVLAVLITCGACWTLVVVTQNRCLNRTWSVNWMLGWAPCNDPWQLSCVELHDDASNAPNVLRAQLCSQFRSLGWNQNKLWFVKLVVYQHFIDRRPKHTSFDWFSTVHNHLRCWCCLNW